MAEKAKEAKALTPTPVGRASAVAPWADRQDVRELQERILAMMPGSRKLQPAEALALAQAAVAHGLDPFNGELWIIPGSGLMAGIKGLRRSGHRQLREEGGGGNYWPEFDQLGKDERVSLGIPEDALAYRCKIRDTHTVNQYTSEIERLLAAGLPWEVVANIVGSKPFTEGIGYAQKSERSKMTLVQRAMKRAEADALKRRFDLPFGIAVGAAGDSDVIEGEFVAGEEDDAPRISQKTIEEAEEGLRPDQAANGKVERPAPPEVVRGWLRKRAGWVKGEADDWSDARRQPDDEQEPPSDKLVQRVAALMGKALKRDGAGDPALERHSVLAYVFGSVVDSTKLTTLREAEALAKWLEFEPMSWLPSGVAAEECRLIDETIKLHEAMEPIPLAELPIRDADDEGLGQQELPLAGEDSE